MSEVEIPEDAKEYVEEYVDRLVERGYNREEILEEIQTIAGIPKIKASFHTVEGAWEYAARLVWHRRVKSCKDCKFAVRSAELNKMGEVFCWISQDQQYFHTASDCFWFFNKDSVDDVTVKRALYELIKARRKR